MAGPARGEVWSVDLDPVRGHEQAGTRPALVVSVDEFNEGPADLVVIATHGLTGWRHVMFGSVAEKVVRHAHCSVLTVRAKREK